jgi:hypothetical protein
MKPFGDGAAGELPRGDKVAECGLNVCVCCERDGGKEVGRVVCYALLRMRPLSISCAECFVVISCGKVDYDKSG